MMSRACPGQDAAVPPAVEEADAKPYLERVEAPEHRGAIDPQALRRRLHRTAAMDGKDDAEMIPFKHSQ